MQQTFWHKFLAVPISLTAGSRDELVTLRDAAEFLTSLETWRQRRAHWVHAGELLLKAGTSGKAKDIDEATMQMRRALRAEGWLP